MRINSAHRIAHAVRPDTTRLSAYFTGLFGLGVLTFFLNRYVDSTYNIPVGEFILIGLLCFELLRQRRVLHITSAHVSLGLAVLLVLWSTLVEYYHSGNVGEVVRVGVRTGLFYAIILTYLHIPDKRAAFRFCLGLVVGYIALFLGMSAYYFTFMESSSYFELKYLIPTPAIILVMLLVLRREIDLRLWAFFAAYLVFAVLSMPFISSRGAFLSVIVGGIAYALGRILPLPRLVFILVALAIPLMPVAVGLFYYEENNPLGLTDWLFSYDYATLSNVERTLMLNMNIDVLLHEPLFGIGIDAMVPRVEPYYVHLTGEPKSAGRSPHNYYLEFGVPFGIPAMLLIIAILWQLYRLMFISTDRLRLSPAVAAAGMCITGWIMLYQPVAGITRIDMFILMMTMLYGLSTHITPAAPASTGRSRAETAPRATGSSAAAAAPPPA